MAALVRRWAGSWHWQDYIEKENLWHHYGRFAKAIAGLDPRDENFQPAMVTHSGMRIYVLAGRKTWLAWRRDAASDWRTELAGGVPSELLRGIEIDLPAASHGRVRCFDPRANKWSAGRLRGRRLILPDFRPSILIRVELASL